MNIVSEQISDISLPMQLKVFTSKLFGGVLWAMEYSTVSSNNREHGH